MMLTWLRTGKPHVYQENHALWVYFHLMNRLLLLCCAAAAFATSAFFLLRAQQPKESNFTGKATRDAAPQVRPARIHFEAGARTKWHTHERGQILLCEEGVARTQMQGHPV